jgi:hypothetical protein
MTRINAAAMTKTPGKRRSDRTSFLLRLTSRFQRTGIGVTKIRASVSTLAAEVTYRFWGLN